MFGCAVEVNRPLGSRVWRGVEVETFIAQVSGPLVGSLALVVGDRAVAEELAKDALVKAAIRWPTISAYDRPEAWVYRVAFNQARSWFRRRTAERRALQRVAAERPVPEAGLDEVAFAMVMREAVAGLPHGNVRWSPVGSTPTWTSPTPPGSWAVRRARSSR